MNDKTVKPPYITYRTWQWLIDELRSHEVIPGVIDRSYLSKRSGSEQSALIAAMKWFSLIDDSGAPTQLLRDYIVANENEAAVMFKKMVEQSYSAVTDGSFALGSATTNMLADKFREYEISGSTLTKSISFFLSAAKDAGIKVSPHAKAPPAPNNGGTKRKTKTPTPLPPTPSVVPDALGHGSKPRPPREGMVAIPIPIFGGQDGVIYLPDQMTAKQWENVIKMTEFILQNYRDTMAEEPMPSQNKEDD
ncbi:DUF5343 domain-containing protein [Stenotrophomonas maltophilia]|uniref:DUF5343 domain-containing protein n=1 Tax=Stenotrophomonas geniculata TaxID=86188 RepID=UPI000EF00CD3|nr:DUF5343 domain-containing protein [Stenotrophomonas geniculata]MBH1853354.1 DUF5343 domain-containing protein [Stenotrophomonas maltophilia]UXB16907.1 DUF5343 domain-containing protein [Stenotrophomonas maltophilia]CAH0063219.1 conserved protein of unknown function [Stenotrophomonas maltophilia]HCL45584.1 hypothetical protein [Pseudomonas sp.]